jgi:cysteinyl-tRNA synthetase
MKNFISNEDFVHKFLVEALQKKHVLRYLLVIVWLIKKYGHKLDISEWYLDTIRKKFPEIVKTYEVLHTLGKTNIKDLNDIIKICKKIYAQYKKEFTIVSGISSQESLTNYIHKRFSDTDLTLSETSVLGIDIKGEWYRYHRNIDNDLDTILGNQS